VARQPRGVSNTRSVSATEPRTPRGRFLHADRYRAEREWKRYEGTAQRDLYRTLRERFLERHRRSGGWVLDVGSGPGRFTGRIGDPASRAVALDLSGEALRLLAEKWKARAEERALPDRVRGDARWAPFPSGQFGTVAILGNTLGFAGAESAAVLDAAESLVAPGGLLLLEIAPGPGERSRYLARLPPGSVARLFRSPVAAVAPRIEREGFRTESPRRAASGTFSRIEAAGLSEGLKGRGWTVTECTAIAPALGPDPKRTEAVRADPKAWAHLLLAEEELGRQTERWREAAAVLIAAENQA
jgi:SAM-dependent methyltransferase